MTRAPTITPMPTVLVLGAGGRFGQVATAAFADAGWRVVAQSRRPLTGLPATVVPLVAPLDADAAIAAAAAGARVVVHAANPVYTDWPRHLLPMARQALAVAEQLGALFMLPGNVYAYGEAMPATLDEDTPERPSTAKGRLRAELEGLLRDRAESGRLRAVVIRAGDFYGSGQGSWLDLAVVKSIGRGRLVYPGPLDRPHAWAYLPDLARAFVAVAGRSLGEAADGGAAAPAFRTLHFAGHTLTGAELLDQVEAAAHDLGLAGTRPLRRGGMPWPLLRALGWVVPMLREIASMRHLWHVPHALDGRRLESFVGPLPSTPPRDALRQALRDLGLGKADSPARWPVNAPAR